MTIFACFGSMIDTEGLIIILGFVLGVEALLASVIAFVISKVFKVGMKKVLGAGAVALLACGTISLSLGWEGPAVLIISSAVVCGCLLALGWLIGQFKGVRKANYIEGLS